MKQTIGVAGMAKEDKQTLVADEYTPPEPLQSTVVVMPERYDGNKGTGVWVAQGWTFHYVLSILATCFCFGPLSVLGLASFLSARQEARNGDLQRAKSQKRAAACWTISAVVVGVVGLMAVIFAMWVLAGSADDRSSLAVKTVDDAERLRYEDEMTTTRKPEWSTSRSAESPEWEIGASDYYSSTPWYIYDATSPTTESSSTNELMTSSDSITQNNELTTTMAPETTTWEAGDNFDDIDEQPTTTTELPTTITTDVPTTTLEVTDGENYNYNYDDIAEEMDEAIEEELAVEQFLAELAAEEEQAKENIGADVEQFEPENEDFGDEEQSEQEADDFGTDQEQFEPENADEEQFGSEDDGAAEDLNSEVEEAELAAEEEAEEEAELEAEEEELAAVEEAFDEETTTAASTTTEIPENSELVAADQQTAENVGTDNEQIEPDGEDFSEEDQFQPEVAQFGVDDDQFEPENEDFGDEEQSEQEADDSSTDQDQFEPENANEEQFGSEDDVAAEDLNSEVEEAELAAEEEAEEEAELEAEEEELAAEEEAFDAETTTAASTTTEIPENSELVAANQETAENVGADNEQIEPDVDDFGEEQVEPAAEDADEKNVDVVTDDLNTEIEEGAELAADEEEAELEAENEEEAELKDEEEELEAGEEAEEEQLENEIAADKENFETEEATTTATDVPVELDTEVEIVKPKNKTEAQIDGEVELMRNDDEITPDNEAPEVNVEESADDLEEEQIDEMLNPDEFETTTTETRP